MKELWTCSTSTQSLNVHYEDCSLMFVMLADSCFPSQGKAKNHYSYLVLHAPLRSVESILSTAQSAEIASTSNAHSHNDMLSSKSGALFSQPFCLTNVLRYSTMASRVENSMAIALPVPSTRPWQFLAYGSNNTKLPLVSFLTATVNSRILSKAPAFVWVAVFKPSSRVMKGKMVLWEKTSPVIMAWGNMICLCSPIFRMAVCTSSRDNRS